MASDKKIEMVEKTYELLKTTSPEDIKARTVAEVCNCTATVIYRYFENLDHLVLFASIKYLEDYIIALQDVVSEESDPLEMEEVMWDKFTECVFTNVPVFEMLFWGRGHDELGDVMFEYYQLFPDRLSSYGGLFTTLFFNSSLEQRTEIILRRAAVAGYFSINDVPILSDLKCLMFHGLIMRYRATYRDPAVAAEGIALCEQLLRSLDDHYRLK